MSSNLVRVLREDPDLGAQLAPAQFAAAREALIARQLTVCGKTWMPPENGVAGHLGFLMLEGLLVREVSVHGTRAWEPLGPGDLLLPWEDDTAAGILDVDSAWSVLAPARAAALDARFAKVLAGWPELIAGYGARLTHRSRCLVDLWAIGHLPVVARVHLLLWFFADRWGRMTPDGLLVPHPFTHAWIARFAGARRPTVTGALTQLTAQGALSRRPQGGWIVHHPPESHRPGESPGAPKSGTSPLEAGRNFTTRQSSPATPPPTPTQVRARLNG